MRTPILALAVLLGMFAFVAAPATPLAAAESAYSSAAVEAQPPQIDVNITEQRAWYTSPVWVAIGVIALVVLILLIVMATRGGGTTVIRD